MSALLLSLLLFSWCFIADGLISDTLRPLQNLTDGQTLVSSNRRFELGFFSPGNSSNRYLGIWYYNLPLTVVWVANKENPIANLLGRLTLNTAGDLFLYNQSTSTVWSTNHTFSPENPILQLLDTGNLVVRNGENSGDDFVWQSFDYISDTLLPGMKLGWNLKTGQNRFMTSWKSDNDPSTGEFTFSLDPPQSPELVLRRGQEKTYRWGPFDGDRFSGIMRKPNAVYRPTYISNSDEVYFAFQVLDEMTLLRFTVTNLGLIRYYRWINDSKQWRMMFTRNRDYCDRYAMCGPYGACFSDDPNCRCLKGFTPRLPKEWSLMDQSSGCRRIHELNCSDRDGFLRYTRLKLPDNSIVLPNRSIEQCRSECLRKCECMAYTGVQAHGNGNGTQCVVWLDALIDIRDFPDGGEVIYIRMARPELESIASTKRRRLVLAIAIVIASIIFGVLLVAGVGCYIYRERKARMRRRKVPHDNDLYNECNNEKEEDDLKPPLFDFDAIFYATNKFSSENKIGHGGFGPVYKGVLPNGLKIAVKRLSQNSGQGLREFKNEVTLIAKLQHRNLVRLLGCCIHGKEKLLVYEYLPNRSLDNFIFDGTKQEGLPWNKRFNIIMGIARGLLYLHQDSRLIIIHRDLKTSNILLDGEMNPKISDFGMARIFRGDQTEEKTRRVVGTYGYMSPEYAMGGHFSVKSDVFSFGVLLLEIISGQKNWGFYHPDHDFNLLGHAWKLWNEKNQMEVIDKRMGSSFSLSEVMRCIQVGLLCVQQCPDDRPTMCSVVSMLSNEMVVLSEPKEPTFFTKISSRPCNGKTNITFNEITITTLDGR